ncbi:hypothetical protein A2U01_0024775 [Trifolium medium]|uniref:Secreted protein n=1 Tax=Trifolium medium TaxID=97028 RepID=A0A392NWA7_9FABA|nr:hypothetical protein [Trifolium medium]
MLLLQLTASVMSAVTTVAVTMATADGPVVSYQLYLLLLSSLVNPLSDPCLPDWKYCCLLKELFALLFLYIVLPCDHNIHT